MMPRHQPRLSGEPWVLVGEGRVSAGVAARDRRRGDRMRRRDFIAALGGAAAWPLAARAQPRSKSYLLGVLISTTRNAPNWIALFDELKRHGFVEGSNLTTVGFGIAPDRLDEVGSDMVRLGVDAIVSGGVVASRAAQGATTTIPIVTVLDDFVSQGFATSFAHPGNNITGVSILGPELDGKRQETLLELLPQVRRIAALADPGSTPQSEFQELQEAARTRAVELSIYQANGKQEIESAIGKAQNDGAQAINVLASLVFNAIHGDILALVALSGLPAIYQWPEWVDEGRLISYGPRFAAITVNARSNSSKY
jgi:putative tryptophan/tyrosine transport system substrate-binding protein